MKATTHLLAAACALLLASLPATAQVFVGSDDFNDNTLTIQGAANQAVGQWRFTNPNSSGTLGAWTETNQRMEYTTTATTGFNRGFLGWVSPSISYNSAPSGNNLGIGGAGLTTGNPYTSSWSAQVEVTNNLTSLTSGFSYTGFEIYSTAAPGNISNAYYGIAVNTAPAATWIVVEWGKWDATLNAGAGDFVRTNAFIATPDSTNVLLRMTYDGSSKVLTTDYSNDGGGTFLAGAVYDLDGAQAGVTAPYNNGFGLEFYASVNNIGTAVTSGQMSFDNLSVSAIPEPSTDAALAGLGALGLAFWQRRRKNA
ncbi:MAG: PEP-CTERM sorting domain-containing protein [Lacunisphaera sp.]|nr:PEP-CTERM sorting domain-containing protein [Lacunisphaera sp.]